MSVQLGKVWGVKNISFLIHSKSLGRTQLYVTEGFRFREIIFNSEIKYTSYVM